MYFGYNNNLDLILEQILSRDSIHCQQIAKHSSVTSLHVNDRGKNSFQKYDHLCCAAMETTQVSSVEIRPSQHYDSKFKTELRYAAIKCLPAIKDW